jgi:hypothetical protein
LANPTASPSSATTYTVTVTDFASVVATDTVLVTYMVPDANLISVDCVYSGVNYSPCSGDTSTATSSIVKNAAGQIYTGQWGSWNALNMGTDNTNTTSASKTGLVDGTGTATTVAIKLGTATSAGAAGGGWRNAGLGTIVAGMLRQEGPYLYYPTVTANHFNWELTGLTPNAHYKLTWFGNGGTSYTNIANSVAGVKDSEGDWDWADIQADAAGVILGNLLTTGNNETKNLYGF